MHNPYLHKVYPHQYTTVSSMLYSAFPNQWWDLQGEYADDWITIGDLGQVRGFARKVMVLTRYQEHHHRMMVSVGIGADTNLLDWNDDKLEQAVDHRKQWAKDLLAQPKNEQLLKTSLDTYFYYYLFKLEHQRRVYPDFHNFYKGSYKPLGNLTDIVLSERGQKKYDSFLSLLQV